MIRVDYSASLPRISSAPLTHFDATG